MKKLVNLEGAKTLTAIQQKTIFGGDPPIPSGEDGGPGSGGSGGGSSYCTCRNGNTGAQWFNSVSSCDDCPTWCANNVPPSPGYTSWVCVGPPVQV